MICGILIWKYRCWRMRKNVVVVVSTSIAVVVVGALIRRWKLWKEQQLRQTKQIIRKFARESATPLTKLWQIADDMVSSMKISLATSDESPTLNMVVSNVTSLPLGYLFLFLIITLSKNCFYRHFFFFLSTLLKIKTLFKMLVFNSAQ